MMQGLSRIERAAHLIHASSLVLLEALCRVSPAADDPTDACCQGFFALTQAS